MLFNGFEPLDIFGPLEVFGALSKITSGQVKIITVSENGGLISDAYGLKVFSDYKLKDYHEIDVFLIPGGMGTRTEVNNERLIEYILSYAEKTANVISICTGAALLAKTGLIDGIKATTNKIAFDWVSSQNEKVSWIKKARWVNSGKFYTSAGVSAGIDATLAFISDKFGKETATKISAYMEYVWNQDPSLDAFS
ncbi:MAG: DJ-1/PfpI family protein [bacterium]